MSRPDLKGIIKQFEAGQPFSLTDSQYKKSTGQSLPKSVYYLLKGSAVARKAKDYGYKLIVQERTVRFEKE